MISVIYLQAGKVERATAIDPAWLAPESHVSFWADMEQPTSDESALLDRVFHFHELAIEDALSALHHPKVESYGHYLYLILHGIRFHSDKHYFATHDTDFFIGPNYLVTVQDGTRRSIAEMKDLCCKAPHLLEEGPLALTHRIIDKMVDHYWSEVEEFRDELDRIEEQVFERPDPALMREILTVRQDVASLRRVVLPQRDVVGRLARREFEVVDERLAYRFRDVHDHLVRLSDEAVYLQDRVAGLLEAHLSSASNQLNQVMKVLTLIATVFMPLTVLTGVYGMNVELPTLPGGPGAQFFWVSGMMVTMTAGMLWFFKRRKWM